MERRFGDAVDSSGPMRFLKERGYSLTYGWEWSKPGISNLGQMERDEFECLLFLVHEWDFGGIATHPQDKEESR